MLDEPAPLPERPLRIVQITDTHLGPWQSVARLRRRIESLVSRDPDLVVLWYGANSSAEPSLGSISWTLDPSPHNR